MSFQLQIKTERPENVTPPRFMPEFIDELTELNKITLEAPTPTQVNDIASQEVVQGPDGGNIIVTVKTADYDNVTDALTAADSTKAWVHPKIIAYTIEHGIKTSNRVINTDTQEVIRDWESR